MKTITATSARNELYKLIDFTLTEHEPIQITGKRGNAVLVSESTWEAIQETLHLVSIPGMKDSMIKGMAESIDDCSKEPKELTAKTLRKADKGKELESFKSTKALRAFWE